jgi:putative ABC transport system ATP-binding protein
MPPPPVIDLESVRYAFEPARPVLDVERFTVAAGERVFLGGPSGSGKSTLLGLVAGVLVADAGHVRVLGTDLGAEPGAARDALRAARIGVIFQMFNLLPYLSVIDNVLLPVRFSAARRARLAAPHEEARRLLDALGLGATALLGRGVGALSIGQQQRVAAARALIGRPDLVIADEPTSSLDWDARAAFLELLVQECRAAGSTLLFVSHDRSLAPQFDRSESLAVLNRVPAAA